MLFYHYVHTNHFLLSISYLQVFEKGGTYTKYTQSIWMQTVSPLQAVPLQMYKG